MKRRVLPSPSSLSIHIRLPCLSTILLAMARPIPVPEYSSRVEALYFSKHFTCWVRTTSPYSSTHSSSRAGSIILDSLPYDVLGL